MDQTTNETHIWGPPGCGKTTYVSRQIQLAASTYGGDSVLVASFTKAAAMELTMRQLPLPLTQVGTLHAHCYRALDNPVIAETRIDDWNHDHAALRLTPSRSHVDEIEPEFTIHTCADEHFAKYQILRARLVPKELWPPTVTRFSAAWTEWKHAHGLMDFTDLLETGLRDFQVAPGDPKVLVVDEAQDLNRLQLALVRQWGRYADHLLLAGDDDQAILTFAGSDPEALLDKDGPEFFRHVLSHSYRVPRAIHALSELWIQRLTRREPKQYWPRDADGEICLYHKGTYKCPAPIVDDAERQLALGRTVMFLTACSYMLEPLMRVLRKRGLPFFNPYRRKRTDWNPLLPQARGASPAERLRAFLRPRSESLESPWVGEDLRRWATWLRSTGVLREGALETIKAMPPAMIVTLAMLDGLFEADVLDRLLLALEEGPLDDYMHWWLDNLAADKRKRADYPARVARHCGVNALADKPSIIVGTGHSVKGGEADVVYVFPDVSASGMRVWEGGSKNRDSGIRLGYVMITRARERLVICEPAGPNHMPLAAVAARARAVNTRKRA
jgi:DNA helicase II / ATP-dependent DNA helicase PcrA